MTLRVYRSTGFLTRSVLRAELVAEVETDQWPEDEAAFADEYGGDIIEVAPDEPWRRPMSKYGMTDSGKRQSFGKGMAIRDTADDKPRPDLISPFAEERQGHWLRMGAAKYAERQLGKRDAVLALRGLAQAARYEATSRASGTRTTWRRSCSTRWP